MMTRILVTALVDCATVLWQNFWREDGAEPGLETTKRKRGVTLCFLFHYRDVLSRIK